MKTFFFCALFGTTVLCAAPTLEIQLFVACNQGDTLTVKNLLQQEVCATQKAFECVLEKGTLDIADLLREKSTILSIKKNWFRKYCRPGKTHVALWLLKYGSGPYYR
jgi:hypothetical protein